MAKMKCYRCGKEFDVDDEIDVVEGMLFCSAECASDYHCEEATKTKTTCFYCGKDLSTVDEIHAAEGMLFCSEDCTVNHYMDEIIRNAKENAKEAYCTYAEVITPKDIGLV